MDVKPEWKKKVVDILLETCIIEPDFSGKLEIIFNQGGIRDFIRSERLK